MDDTAQRCFKTCEDNSSQIIRSQTIASDILKRTENQLTEMDNKLKEFQDAKTLLQSWESRWAVLDKEELQRKLETVAKLQENLTEVKSLEIKVTLDHKELITRLEKLESQEQQLRIASPPILLRKASRLSEDSNNFQEIVATKETPEKSVNGYYPPRCEVSVMLPFHGYYKISYRDLMEWEGDVYGKLKDIPGQELRNGLAPLDIHHLVLKVHLPGNQ